MPTLDTTAAPISDTDGNFRAWINTWHTLLTTSGGWIQTADTGQINFATATRPGGANTKVGYALYAMDDSLQATNPIILKVAFGSGSAQNTPGIWFAVGTNTDGAGNFIDPNDDDRPALLFDQYSQSGPAFACTGNNSVARPVFGSVGTDRFAIFMFEATPDLRAVASGGPPGCKDSSTQWCNHTVGTTEDLNYPILFAIERARDWDGNTIGSHVFITWPTQAGRLSRHIYLSTAHDLVPLPHIAGIVHSLIPPLVCGLSNCVSIYAEAGTPVTDAPASGIIPFKRNTYPAPPGVNVLLSRHSRFRFDENFGVCYNDCTSFDYITGRTVEASPYGTALTYRVCAGIRGGNYSDSGQDVESYVHIRYE